MFGIERLELVIVFEQQRLYPRLTYNKNTCMHMKFLYYG